MRFSLRTLLIVLVLMPPLAAGVWREIDRRRIVSTIEEDSWQDVGGPGTIKEFPGSGCFMETDPHDVEEEQAIAEFEKQLADWADSPSVLKK